MKSPGSFNWKSEYGLFVHGTDLSRQKNYAEAEEYLRKPLKRIRSRTCPDQMAQTMYREGMYEKAREFAGQALCCRYLRSCSKLFPGTLE